MLPNFDNLLIVMRFNGEYRVALTDKNRLVVPVRMRESLSGKAGGLEFCLLVQKDHVQMMPAEYLAELENNLKKLTAFNTDVRKFSRAFYSQVIKLTADSQWRLTLPTQILTALGVGLSQKAQRQELIVLGVGESMEIWQEDKWNLAKQALNFESEAISDRIAYLLMKLK